MIKDVQFPEKLAFLFQPKRYKVAYGGRGGTKSWGFARALLIMGAERKLLILCAREVQESIEASVHSLLKKQIVELGLSSKYEVLTKEIRGTNGTQFIFAGLSDLTSESLKSYEAVDILWAEEAKNISKKSWSDMIPTIRKSGSEIWISFNPELETDETYVRFVLHPPEKSTVVEIGWIDNPWLSQELNDERLHCQKTDPDNYDNIWGGKCKPAVEGAIYYKELLDITVSGRYRDVPYDPLLKVHTFWDLGNSNNLRILLAQKLGSEVRIIDHIAGGYANIAEFVGALEAKKYRYGTDYLPHDAAPVRIDTGVSTEKLLQRMGRTTHVLPVSGVEGGIQATKMMLPRVFIDKTKCALWYDAMKRYRRHKNEKTGATGGPVHDDASHDADTARYLAMAESLMQNAGWDNQTIKYPKLGHR